MPLLSDLSWPRLTRSATEPAGVSLEFLPIKILIAKTKIVVAIQNPIAKLDPTCLLIYLSHKHKPQKRS